MTLLLAYFGGVLTILSPCILPIVPLVFARSDRPFRRNGLPMLLGLAVTFALVAVTAAVSVSWLLEANEVGRGLGLLLAAAVGLSLLIPRIADEATRPRARLGAWVAERAERVPSTARNVAVGVTIGLLWAPCAGPILGLIIATAALGSAPSTAVPLLAFALGAATSLGMALLAGGRVLAALKRYGARDVWVRRSLGVATLATVLVLALGWDAKVFARAGLVATAHAEEVLISRLSRQPIHGVSGRDVGQSLDDFAAERAGPPLGNEGEFPGFPGATRWINSEPLSPESLRGKVVLVEFWTFLCYNCLNALPHVKALEAKYRDLGFVVVGVHTPEFAREKSEANVRRAVRDLGITYPVVMDNSYAIWNAFGNRYWPAAYFIDASGTIRYHHFGEGRYDEQEQVVRKLLAEAGLTK